MGTATAIITAGGSHPNDGGITPVSTLSLWENSRPSWRCDHVDERPSTVWVPHSPETILADGLLLLAAVSIGDRRVVQLLDDVAGKKWEAEHVEVADVIGLQGDDLMAAVKDAMQQAKLVFTVLPESSILGQLDVVRSLETDVEVCLPAYWRRSNQWQPEPVIGGQLP